MRTYELVIVISPELTEEKRKKLLETIKSFLGSVKIAKEEAWGSKALAYAIKKQLTGFYYDFQLEGETFPADFEKRLVNMEDVLRHLVVRTK